MAGGLAKANRLVHSFQILLIVVFTTKTFFGGNMRNFKHLAFAVMAAVLFITGCSSVTTVPKKPFTVNDLEGKWAGEWIWTYKEGGSMYSGKAEAVIKRTDASNWSVRIATTQAEPFLKDLTVGLKEENPATLTGEFMGVKMNIILKEDNEQRVIEFSASGDALGSATGTCQCVGTLLRGTYQISEYKDGKGKLTMEYQKSN